MPSPGHFQLFPQLQPALPAGSYQLQVDHELQATPPNGADGTLNVAGQDFLFKILAPRYSLPPDQVLSTFPPASAVGDWRERLPQLVLKRRTLPWERNPEPAVPYSPATPPWLALVVLAEGEGALSKDVPVGECVTPGRVLTGDNDTQTGRYLLVRRSIVQKIFPTREDLPLLCHLRKVDLSDTELALGDDDGYLAVVLSNRLPQPGPPAAEPTADVPDPPLTSVRYTAYLVNLEGQLDLLPTTEESESEDTFRPHMPELLLPALFEAAPVGPVDVLAMGTGPVRALALPHGRSSEGAAPRTLGAVRGTEAASAQHALGPIGVPVASADDARPIQMWVQGTGLFELAQLAGHLGELVDPSYRFPVLLSWDFVCTGEGGFERLMNDLRVGMLGTLDEATPPTASTEIAPTGHVRLAHTTRSGERTEAWYRGPLVPQPTSRTAPEPDGTLPLAHTGDALRKVTPDGREDVGLAAAFEIGRLLALSKPGIVSGLMSWREALFGASRAHRLSMSLLAALPVGIHDGVRLGKRALEDLLSRKVLVPFAQAVPARVAPKARAFASARIPGGLPDARAEDVLAGLGLSADHMDGAEGSLEAVARLPLTVGPAAEDPLSASPAEIATLRGVLDAQVDRLMVDTLKLDQRLPKAAGATDRPDALDRVLAGGQKGHG